MQTPQLSSLGDRPSRPHLPLLDGIRGVAAFIVVIHHFSGQIGIPQLAQRGYLAVDLFFMLSGYVISYSYGDRLKDRLTIRSFLEARIKRLYPMIIFGTALAYVLSFWNLRHTPASFRVITASAVLGALAVPSFFKALPAALFPLNGPIWSVFWELVANAYYSYWQKSQNRHTVFVVTALLGLFGLLALASIDTSLGRGSRPSDWQWGAARIAFSFFAGCLLFQCRTMRLPHIPGVLAVVLCVAVMIVPDLPVANSAFDLAAMTLLFPLSIRGMSSYELNKVLRSACRISGEFSYPLYALHYPFADFLGSTYFVQKQYVGVRIALAFALALSLTAFAHFVFRRLDTPVRGWLSRAKF